MKYIKTFEKLEDIKKLQASKLAILKFFDRVIKIYKKYHNKKLQFRASENYNALTYYELSFKGDKLCELNILRDKKHQIQFILNNLGRMKYPEEFFKFMRNILNITNVNMPNFSTQTNVLYNISYLFTAEELNELSDKLLDEFDMYMMAKKYNVG